MNISPANISQSNLLPEIYDQKPTKHLSTTGMNRFACLEILNSIIWKYETDTKSSGHMTLIWNNFESIHIQENYLKKSY